MISLGDAIANMKLTVDTPFQKEKKDTHQRRCLFRELYPYYERDWKRQTWKNYNIWLRSKKLEHSKENMDEFKKTQKQYDIQYRYYPKISPASLASFWLVHMKTEDLYYLLSIAKDKENRKESFNKWLFWAIKNQ